MQILRIGNGEIKLRKVALARLPGTVEVVMSKLRITGVAVDVVHWPLKMKRRHGVGDIEQSLPGAIVKISTDAGITGWGEAAPWSVFTGTAEANANGIRHYLAPLLLGADTLKISTLMRLCEATLKIGRASCREGAR